MITKKLFVDSVNAMEAFNNLDRAVCEVTNGGITLFDIDEVSEMRNCLSRVLEYCTKDFVENRFDESNLEYFMWDADFGKEAENYYILDRDEDGNPVKIVLKTAEDLWDFLVANNPDIEDTETKENIEIIDEDSKENPKSSEELFDLLVNKILSKYKE